MASLLKVTNLTITASVEKNQITIIDELSLHVNAGEVLGLVGESGCGKSVTMDSVMGLLGPGLEIKSGEISFASESDLASLSTTDKRWQKLRGKRMAMIFQEPMSSFSPLYTIGAQISDVIRHHLALSKTETRERVLSLLEKVRVPDPETVIDRYPFELSGGLRQRAMIAKALACDPELLIADEPTTALDVTIQAGILELLRELVTDLSMALVFISHDLGVISKVCDRVAIMYAGTIIEDAPVGQIFSLPTHPYTRALLKTLPKRGDFGVRLETIPGTVPAPEARPGGCPFHPRCELAVKGNCDQHRPALATVAPNHFVACPIVLREGNP